MSDKLFFNWLSVDNFYSIVFIFMQFRPLVEGRSFCGFVGLKNAGATCYMNSVLQQLFVQPEIKESILSVEREDEEGESEGDRYLQQNKWYMYM